MKTVVLVVFCFVSAVSCKDLKMIDTAFASHSNQEASPKHLLDDIILRFYHVQRLAKGVGRLVWMSDKQLVPLCLHCEIRNTKQGNKTLILSNNEEITFTHERIIWCLEHIENHHSLDPFLEVWDDLTHYQLVSDKLVLREFTYLLFYLYRDVVHQEAFLRSKNPDPALLESILLRVPSLEAAELEDILDVLDLLIDELPAFIEHYELSSNLTWKEWAKKYWLIAPVGAAVLILKTYLHYSLDRKGDTPLAFEG
jgi:hypothetical protein